MGEYYSQEIQTNNPDKTVNKELDSASYFVAYFKKKFWEKSEKYQSIFKKYNELEELTKKALKDNIIETGLNLNSLSKEVYNNDKSEFTEIVEKFAEIEEEFFKNIWIQIENLNIIDLNKLDEISKEMIFKQMDKDFNYILWLNNSELIIWFFNYLWKKWYIDENYYSKLNWNLKNNIDVIKAYLDNSNNANLNIIPEKIFSNLDNLRLIITDIYSYKTAKQSILLKQLFSKLSINKDALIKTVEIAKNIISPEEFIKIWNYLNNTDYKFIKDIFPEIVSKNITNHENEHNLIIDKLLLFKPWSDTEIIIIENISSLDYLLLKSPEILNNKIFESKLIKYISENAWRFYNFSSLNYNKDFIWKLMDKNPTLIAIISPDLSKEKNIIDKALKSKEFILTTYFINIDSSETLIYVYNKLKSLWIKSNEIFKIPNISSNTQYYLSAKEWNSKLFEIRKDYYSSKEFFNIALKWLNENYKKDYLWIINNSLKNDTNSKVFLDELLNHTNFWIKEFQEHYEDFKKLCPWNNDYEKDKVLTEIFNEIAKKQDEIYNNPNELKKLVKDNLRNNWIDLNNILKNHTNLKEFVHEIQNEDWTKELILNTEKLISNFKDFCKKETSDLNKNQQIEKYLKELWFWDKLSLEEIELRELIWWIIQYNFIWNEKKAVYEITTKNPNLILWTIKWDKNIEKEYEKIFNKIYNDNLEKEGLPKDRNTNENWEEKNSKLDSTKNENSITIVNENSSNWSYNILSKDWKIILDWLSKDEAKLAQENEKVQRNIIDFKEKLNILWLSNLWEKRDFIFQWIENTIWKKIFVKDWNFMDKNEVSIFLYNVLKSIRNWEKNENWLTEKEKNDLSTFKWKLDYDKLSIFIAGVNNSSDIITKQTKTSEYWSRIETIFRKKFIDNTGKFDLSKFSKNLE